ncbi:MAG: NUDIX domain-containing protein [Candidatus Pacearchaeota archaeon]|nr:NUDIX domain-containing protein [Candidatus Pacearchaeota archaeon]
MIEQKSAGVVVYYLKDGQPIFLLLKYPSYWGFSKGLIEQGEDEKQAAIRELEEEVGIKVENFISGFEEKQTLFFKFKGEFIRKQVVLFLARVTEQQANSTKISWEHEEFVWLNLDDAISRTRIKANKELLKKAYEFITEYEKQRKLF